MSDNFLEQLKARMDEENFAKLSKLNNEVLYEFLNKQISRLQPKSIFIWDGTDEASEYIRSCAVEQGEERKLAIAGHTIHFDGYNDQARDKAHTKFLVPADWTFDSNLNSIDRDEGLSEINGFLDGIMKGKELYILFFTLGPSNSEFSIPSVQMTDSPYVAHSEMILYRKGYDDFRNMTDKSRFFKFVHGEGELENGVSKNLDKRRIYIDLVENVAYSSNTQYGGNTLGLKKLAMRLAIQLASKEGWLTEHMFLMGVNGPGGRISYFTGAFPSMCGKTSTAMLPGESIVGDDIVYLRNKDGKVRSVNVEAGMFGIIEGVNSKDDPLLWGVLHNPGEIIFSNVLLGGDNNPYWHGSDASLPDKGFNHSGEWYKGKKDDAGKEIPISHKNARLTVAIDKLPNVNENLHNPEGVEVSGIIYGGRDSDTSVPVQESFDWTHGIVAYGAALESETTAAALGQEGVRKFNPMSNLDFLSIPIADYIKNNIEFGKKSQKPPKIFGVNYFLKDGAGNFLNERTDKSVWLKWAELRCYDEVPVIDAPTGMIPEYEDLKRLFKEVLNKEYSKEDYQKQFTIRVAENLAKIERIKEIYKTKVQGAPKAVFDILDEQKARLEEVRMDYGDYVEPFSLK